MSDTYADLRALAEDELSAPCTYTTRPDQCGIPGHEVSTCDDHGFYEPCPIMVLSKGILALLDDLAAARGEAESTAESLGGMVEWLAEVVVDTREALRVGGCGEHMLTAEQMGALEAATRILSRERNAHPSRYDRMKAERDALAAEVEAMRAILAGLVRRALDGTP